MNEGTEYRRLDFDELLDRSAAATPDPGGGAVAALAASLAAGLVAMAARVTGERWAGAEDAAAAAERLQDRLSELAREDAAGFRRALEAIRGDAGEREKAAALDRAGRAPIAIAEAAAEVVGQAADARPHVADDVAVDLGVAARIGEAAGRAALDVARANPGADERRIAAASGVLDRAAADLAGG